MKYSNFWDDNEESDEEDDSDYTPEDAEDDDEVDDMEMTSDGEYVSDNEGDADGTMIYHAAALDDIEGPYELVALVQDDSTIMRWIDLVQRREQLGTDPTPDMDEVEEMRVSDGVLQHLVRTHDVGLVGIWVPVVTRGVARRWTRDTHSKLAHPGISRTASYVTERIWCEGLMGIIEKTLKSCHTCQMSAVQSQTYTPMSRLGVSDAREHVYIDLLHIGNSGDIETDALTITDLASGYYEVYPVADSTSASVIDALRDNWFSRHGAPLKLTSDNGRQFASSEFNGFLLSYLAISKHRHSER